MNRRRLLTVLAAVVLALSGMFVIVAYVSAAEERAQEGSELVSVLVATEDIEANVPASELTSVVRLIEIPRYLLQPDAVRSLEELGDHVTVGPIRGGEQIVARQFGEPDAVRSSSAQGIAKGKEIVTVALEPQRAVGGRLAPGDQVSVIVSIGEAEVADDVDPTQTSTQENTTGVVLNEVPVVAVSGGVSEEAAEAANVVLVSLEVDGSDAERVVFAMEHGTVWLTLNGENVEPPNEQTRSPSNIYDLGGGS